jgi:hypothetical protein
MNIKVCRPCNGKGEVPSNSPHGVNPPNMTGEIAIYAVSVCKHCRGTGMARTVVK